MSDVPADRLYSDEHAWARFAGARVVVGITDFAQRSLGELVFVRLRDLGATVMAGASLGELESLKSTSDLYAPVAGVVVAHNPALAAHPELVNADPYGEGWLCELEVSTDASGLLDPSQYRAVIGDA